MMAGVLEQEGIERQWRLTVPLGGVYFGHDWMRSLSRKRYFKTTTEGQRAEEQ